jgi:hypothetical protein
VIHTGIPGSKQTIDPQTDGVVKSDGDTRPFGAQQTGSKYMTISEMGPVLWKKLQAGKAEPD